MIRLKMALIDILMVIVSLIVILLLLSYLAYNSIDGIKFKLNNSYIEFNDLTYGDIKNYEVPSNTFFVIVDGDEQVDITSREFDNNDSIKSVTVVVKNPKSICDFSVFDIHVGDSEEVVTANMPSETKHVVDDTSNIMMSKYVDKDDNVLIIGTDLELNIVDYITIRIKE